METNGFKENSDLISALLDNYFNGIYYGNAELLESVFHPGALVLGDINGKPYFKSVKEYIEGVRNRVSPETLGESFKMKVLSIEIINSTAIAKVNVPMFEFNYYDLLSLHQTGGKWLIVNKMLTHVSLD